MTPSSSASAACTAFPRSTGGSAQGGNLSALQVQPRVSISGHPPGFSCVSAPFLLPLRVRSLLHSGSLHDSEAAGRGAWQAAEGQGVPAGT